MLWYVAKVLSVLYQPNDALFCPGPYVCPPTFIPNPLPEVFPVFANTILVPFVVSFELKSAVLYAPLPLPL